MIRNVPRPGGFLSLFRRAFAVLLFGFVLLAAASPGFAQGPVTPAFVAEAESLVQALVALNARYQLAGPAERSQLLDELERVAAERQQLLPSLIKDHSDEVLRLALPQGLRSSLPDQVQAYLEEQQTVEGELEVLHVDHKDPRKSHYRYFLTTPSGKRFSLHFVANPPGLLSGAKVRVDGAFLKRAGPADLSETAGAMAVPDGVANVETLAAGGTSGSTDTRSALTTVLPSTFGAQKTLVILVNFQDKATEPYTPDTARNIVFNTTSNFDLENSFQQAWLTGDVYGWYTIALDSTVCDSGQIASYAEQAATAAGVNLSAYTRYVYAFPDNACGWWGLGTVGGNPSQAWINGSLALKEVGHEMGHNFGLYHSHGLECGTTTLGSNCTTIEYGDTLDKMGSTAAGHFNAFQKERLGWLNYASSPPILTVQADGTYWLEPYETGPGVDPKALKILKSVDPTTGTKTWYYVEYRQAVGFDSFLSSNGNVLNGVVVHIGTENSGNSSDLLDMTPATSSWNDPALEIGQSFYDPDAGVTISPTWANGSNAQVSVSVGPPGCAPTNPALALSPSQSQWVQAGATGTYTVTLTNKDNARCSESSFNLQAGVPSGWTAAFASTMLTLEPGASASTTLTVTSSASAADGFYTIPVGATNGADMSYTASTSATVVIAASLNVVVPTNQPSYTPNPSVGPAAQVYGNGSPVLNAVASTRAVAAAVTISPGSSIQAAINANPNGTVFNLAAGTWTNQVFTPKPGNQFIGAPGGGTILTGSNTTNRIYGSDGTVNQGVLMKDFTIERYGVPVAGPAIDSGVCGGAAIHGVNGWTFQNMTFRLNNCVGLNMGANSVVIGGKYIDNGHAGIMGTRSHNIRIESAEIGRNNTRRDDPFWDAAGVKIVDADAMVLRNNYVHDNHGPGLWCDINCRNSLIEGNTVINNNAAGIMYEISSGNTIIRNNVANNNAVTGGEGQIFVSSANGVEVYGNNVKSSGNQPGILIQSNNRPDAKTTMNNSVHNNVITFTGTTGRSGFANFGGPVGSGNSSNNNAFYLVNLGDVHFFWNTSTAVNWTSYRSASGQDANSTLQVGNASVSGNTQGCPALTGCGTDQQVPSVPVGLSATAFSASQVDLSWLASTDNVGVTGYRIFRGGVQIGTSSSTSYSDLNLTAGTTYSYSVAAYDAVGNVSAQSASVSITTQPTTTAQSPFAGTPSPIPGTIQAEHFDVGGEGVAYHDSDSANNGGLYRPNESVDIKAASDSGGGYAIGWIQPNEWFEYTVNVASPGTFTFAARVATIYPGKRFHVEIDGVNVTGSLAVPVTGSTWDTTWGTVTKSGINLTAGPHIMRVVADTDLCDLNYFTWTAQPTADTQAPSTPGALSASALSSSQVNLSWSASTDNVGVTGYRISRGGVQIGTSSSTSYSDLNLTAGTTYSYSVAAYDAVGNVSTQSASVSITTQPTTTAQSPFAGTPSPIPGTIQAEHFDVGGEGVAYHDSDSTNSGGLYRPNESVDIKAASDTGGGYAIGWIVQPNEWLEYTVTVASSGTFTFAARVATIYSGKRFHVEIDGVNVTGSLAVPVTGSAWDTTWGTVTKSGINLTAGPHIMRVVADTDLFDLNYFTWTAQAANTAINVPVALSSDDAEEQQSTGRMYLNSSDLELTEDPSQWGSTAPKQVVGLRFANIAIPKGATITNAYIQFTSKETSTTATSLTIRAQASDNSAVFTTTAFNVSSRPLTSATVSWSPVVWSVVGEAGTKQRTPNLASVIQEVVNRSGWKSGNSIAVIVKGSGRRTAWAYDGSTSGAPLLHIDYSVQ